MKKKVCLAGFFLLIAATAMAQRKFSLATSTNFSFAARGLGTNDAGIGITVHPNYVLKEKLQLRGEASLDHFIGNKLLFVDPLGNPYTGNPTLVGFKAGPEYLLSPNLSFAALYGFVSYHYFDEKIQSGNAKLLLNAHLGQKKKTILSLYYSTLTGKGSGVQFWGTSIGYRFL